MSPASHQQPWHERFYLPKKSREDFDKAHQEKAKLGMRVVPACNLNQFEPNYQKQERQTLLSSLYQHWVAAEKSGPAETLHCS